MRLHLVHSGADEGEEASVNDLSEIDLELAVAIRRDYHCGDHFFYFRRQTH